MPKNDVVRGITALIIGFLIVISIPEAKAYLDRLIGAIITGVILGIIVAIVILTVWWLMNR